MSKPAPSRRRSASAQFVPQKLPVSARDRVLFALELGRRDALLRRLGDDARSRRDLRAR